MRSQTDMSVRLHAIMVAQASNELTWIRADSMEAGSGLCCINVRGINRLPLWSNGK